MAWQTGIKREYVEEPELEELYGIDKVLTTKGSMFMESNKEEIKIEKIESLEERDVSMDTELPVTTYSFGTIKMEEISENESTTSNEEIFDDDDDDRVPKRATQNELDAQYFPSQTTEPTAIHLNIKDKGNLSYEIEENDFCAKSLFTGWHLQQTRGVMRINLTCKNVTETGPLTIRVLLVREDKTYMEYNIDQVCTNHSTQNESLFSNIANRNVLKGADGFDWYYGKNGPRRSICFDIGCPSYNGIIQAVIGFRNICSDTCPTTSDPSYKNPEKGRDKIAILTIEKKDSTVIARRSFSLWTKSVIRQIDLVKRTRREPKGGAAKKAILRRLEKTRLLNQNEVTSIKEGKQKRISNGLIGNDKGSQTHLYPELRLYGSTLKLLPLTRNYIGQGSVTQPNASLNEKHTINIITQVETITKVPSSREILESILKHCANRAMILNIPNKEFQDMINSHYYMGHSSE